jgi:L-lactate dehydrogenase
VRQRYWHTDLISCALELFGKAGLDEQIARAVAEILVDADLLGYDTHGLQFVPTYLSQIEAGRTATSGEPDIVKDHGHALLLDGNWLPGQWVMLQALELAFDRISHGPVVTLSIRRAQNISCLATYAKRACERGWLAFLTASGPLNAAVTPHGGSAPRYSTNPIAVGIPAPVHPILIDTSTSSTSNRQVERLQREGRRLHHPALVSANGEYSDDPAVLSTHPPGAILPAGGIESGHKGFALAMMVEAMTSALCGWGRRKGSESGGNNVFLQLMDPEAFGGLEGFMEETGQLGRWCRGTPPRRKNEPVRMPGDRAFAVLAEQMEKGVALHPDILPMIAPFLEKYGIPAPLAIDSKSD